eukprot:SAG11_NODE_155_length_14200_cov_178.683781_2_plen_139_part_00
MKETPSKGTPVKKTPAKKFEQMSFHEEPPFVFSDDEDSDEVDFEYEEVIYLRCSNNMIKDRETGQQMGFLQDDGKIKFRNLKAAGIHEKNKRDHVSLPQDCAPTTANADTCVVQDAPAPAPKPKSVEKKKKKKKVSVY